MSLGSFCCSQKYVSVSVQMHMHIADQKDGLASACLNFPKPYDISSYYIARLKYLSSVLVIFSVSVNSLRVVLHFILMDLGLQHSL